MEYAIDVRDRREVHASKASNGRAYKCPVCKGPVVLRAGHRWSTRVAHFAHVANTAKPDCENYFPSQYAGYIPHTHEHHPSPEWKQKAFDVSLLRKGDYTQLMLNLPPSGGYDKWTGLIKVQGLVGQHVFTWSQLRNGGQVPVAPSTSQIEAFCEGDVSLDYASFLSEGAPGLEATVTCFHEPVPQGRRVGNSEELQWGERYCVVARPGDALPETLRPAVRKQSRMQDFVVIDLELPHERARPLTSVGDDWARWLGHAIVEPVVKWRLLSSLPHHCDEFGTFVLRADARQLIIGFSRDPGELRAVRTDGIEIEAIWNDDCTVQVSLPPNEDITLHTGGRRIAEFRSEECPPFLPRGVDVWCGGTLRGDLMDLLPQCADIREKLSEVADLQLRFGDPRLERLIRMNDKPFSDATLQASFADLACDVVIEADNLGRVVFPARAHVSRHRRALAPHGQALLRWLLSLPRPSAGERGIALHADTSSVEDPLVSAVKTRRWPSRYQPYLQALARELSLMSES